MDILELDFYWTGHVTEIAKRLLGAVLWTNVNGKISSGKIVEVEAYTGEGDKASHAYNGRRTKRNEIMYSAGGVAYVYLCYGIHTMFNIVTNQEGRADAVLIRAIEPMEGIENMLERKSANHLYRIGSGPGNVCKALGIEMVHNGIVLNQKEIWITEGEKLSEEDIIATTRIGVEYAKEDALLPWRYYIRGNNSVSKK